MAKDTYRTSFDIALRFKHFLDELGYGEKRQLLENLLDALIQAEARTPGAIQSALRGELILKVKGPSNG